MIVLDASAAVLGLVGDGEARRTLSVEDVAVPHLADAEVLQALRRQEHRGALTREQASTAISTWGRLGLRRHGASATLGRIWQLRENLSAYDATYVALAELLGCHLMTADARMAHAPGPRCPITMIRR